MLDSRPREPAGVSWLLVVLWAGVIYATIPVTRALQQFVRDTWGSEIFTYGVVAVIAAATAASLVWLRRRGQPWHAYAWLAAVAAVFVVYTWQLWRNPEEALHFVQYGALSALTYRALCHRIRDVSIYPTAVFIVAMFGMLDEAIQWITPRRYWGLDDIGLNVLAAVLVQVAIARGLRPTLIAAPLAPRSIARACTVAGFAVAFLGLALLNTPARMAWYGPYLPGLGLLESSDTIMAEYGHLHTDPEIGVFRSRLTLAALAERDRSGGAAAAAILDAYRAADRYGDFLKRYTPVNAPFLHETRVRLFRRDRYRQRAVEDADDPERVKRHLTIALREHQIMERYFPVTLAASSYRLDPATIAAMARHLDADMPYESGVSRGLITRFSEAGVATMLAAVLLGLAAAGFYYRHRDRRDRRDRKV